MDPLSQGVLGASLSQATTKKEHTTKEHIVVAGILGFLAGMAPDLDVLIQSSSDPLLFLEYHRQFTHSLLFIPFGSLICALVLHPLIAKSRGFSLKAAWLYCALGYATHGLLDACTTYGTMLFWPISDMRVAWNNVSIIDPFFTLPLLILITTAAIKKNPLFARLAFCWAITYLLLGMVQRDRAIEAGTELATQRGHTPITIDAKPTFANLVVWKTVYDTQDEFFVDAVRVGVDTHFFPGDQIKKLNIAEDFPWVSPDSQQAIDIERFRWFSNGYIAKDPKNKLRIIDIRYSIVPNQINALWSIELSPIASSDAHVKYLMHRENTPEGRNTFKNMVLNLRD